MTDRPTLLKRSSQPWGLQPPLAWIVILGFGFLSILSVLGGVGRVLNLAFPAGSLIVGVFLYFRYPILYMGFTWWIWFLTPLVRRLADWKSGFTNPSPILLAPYLVTLITLIALCKYLPKTLRQGGFPFVLSLVGVFYSFCIGLVYRSPIQVGIALLDWLSPILFGFHIFVNWQNYPNYRQNLQRVFLWGVLVMGAYGVIQFLVLPDWDRVWLIKSGFVSVGKPFPFLINVWSTLNANRPFGTVMMAGLLLLIINKKNGILGFLATGIGYLAFFLTKKRTTWLTFLLGLLILGGSLKPKTQMRLLVTLCVTILIAIPLMTLEPFSGAIGSRLETFTNLENDPSLNGREEIYQAFLDRALVSFIGTGLGGQFYDSAILALLLDFGWIGTIFYMSGFLSAMIQICYHNEGRHDPFLGATKAIALCTFAQIPLGNPMIEIQGIVLWGFLGIALAAQKYYQHDSTSRGNSIDGINPQDSRTLRSPNIGIRPR